MTANRHVAIYTPLRGTDDIVAFGEKGQNKTKTQIRNYLPAISSVNYPTGTHGHRSHNLLCANRLQKSCVLPSECVAI